MKSAFGVLIALAAAVSLVVGASASPSHADQIISAVQAAQQGLKDCIADTYNDAQFAPLQPHIPMSVVGVTAAQRNDIHVVTDQEAVLVAAFGMRTKACRDAYLRQMNSVLPSVASMIASAYSQNEASLADLIQKKVSWGDYVKRVEATYNALKPQLMTELQRIGDELDKENPVQ